MASFPIFLPSENKGPYPLILILPVLGRVFFLPDFWIERKIASFFRNRGFAAAIIQRDFFTFHKTGGVEQIDAYLWQTVRLAQETLDILSKHPAIDKGKIGTLGISFGGIINVLLSAKDPRIKASVVALAGGNIPEILSTSRDPLVKSYYSEVLKTTGFSRDELTSKLKTALTGEPLKWAGKIKSGTILYITAKYDHVVQPKFAESLRACLRKPEMVVLPLGHYFSLLALSYLQRKAFAFFRRKFS